MRYEKEIVCLANSRKPPSGGRCIAGIERDTGKWTNWVRPVSARLTEEISEEERRYEDGSDPQILDTISIQFSAAKPCGHQQENHVIDANWHWEKTGSLSWNDVGQMVQPVNGPLWTNGESTYHGLNDKVPEQIATNLQNSLVLVQPDDLTVSVRIEGDYQGPGKLKARANFGLGSASYRLTVTDPKIEREFIAQGAGQYQLNPNDLYMCISLSGPFYDYCFKLVASIIRRPT